MADNRNGPMQIGILGLLAIALGSGGCTVPGLASSQPVPNLERKMKVLAAFMTVVSWSPDGSKLAVGSKIPPLHILDASTGNDVGSIFDAITYDAEWSPDSRYLATTSETKADTLQIWDADSRRVVFKGAPPPNQLYDLVWSHDGTTLMAVGGNGIIFIDTATWRTRGAWTYKANQAASNMVWSADDKTLAFSPWVPETNQQSLVIMDVGTLPEHGIPDMKIKQTIPIEALSLNALSISPDGRYLAGAFDDGHVQVWDTTNGDMIVSLTQNTNLGYQTVNTVAWSPDGKKLASGGLDETVIIWDPFTGQRLDVFKNPDTVMSVAWSPDGKKLAAACETGDVRIWRVP